MLEGLRTVIYTVADTERAKQWYTELLGFPPYFDEPFYIGFNVGGYELGLLPVEPETNLFAGDSVTYWGVPDADIAYSQLLAHGATPHQPIQDVGGGVRIGTVTDPFGCILGVIYNPHFKLT